MGQYVVIRDMCAGSELVIETWQETKVFDGAATIDDVMAWAMGEDYAPNPFNGKEAHSRKRITITRPHD